MISVFIRRGSLGTETHALGEDGRQCSTTEREDGRVTVQAEIAVTWLQAKTPSIASEQENLEEGR